jgi:hypothetical protein
LTAYGCYAISCREALVVRGDAWRDAVAGALGGFAGGLAGLAGSFVTIWCSMRGWDKRQQRAVYQPFILAMLALFERITSRQFQVVLSALLIVSGLGLLGRSL